MTDRTLQDIANESLAQTGSASAAIFVVEPSGALALRAAAGISGGPLERLVAAVRSPDHPIARTAADGDSAFDVTPIAPGGPALRSHIAIVDRGAPGRVVGVVALAHQLPLNEDRRRAASELALQAADLA